MDSDDTASALSALLPELGTQMAGAARHILAQPQDVAVFSMRELARRVGVPPVTLVRLAQRLGLPGYAALRRHYVDEVRSGRVFGAAATRNADAARGIADAMLRGRGPADFVSEFFAAERAILDVAEKALDPAALDAAVDLLAMGRRIFVMARRTAFPAAFAFAYALRKARPDVMLLDDMAGAPEVALEDAQPGDVLVAMTFAPYNRLTLGTAQQAAAAGLRVIGLTDTVSSPMARFAGRLLFVAPTASRAFPESALGALALANLMVAMTVARLGAAAQQRIRANEQRIVRSGEYTEAGPSRR